jgi:peptide chain release factor 3
MDPIAAGDSEGTEWARSVDEHELLSADGYDFDQSAFREQRSTPVLFTAAVVNFGVGDLLDVIHDLAPGAEPRVDATGNPRPLDAPFSAQVFKVQAGMNAAHRDRLAFARVCSGVFRRGEVVTHEPSGRDFVTKYVHTVFGRDRETVDVAHPGDIIGLVNAADLRAGDTLFSGTRVQYPTIPSFAPEHFRQVSAKDPSRYKQFQRGIEQLDQEGVIQVLRSERRSQQTPVLAAVGPMQFEVVSHRMEHDFRAPVRLESLPYTFARRTRHQDISLIERRAGVEVVARQDGTHLALFSDQWQVKWVLRDHPDVVLESLTDEPVGATAGPMRH